MLTEAPPPSPSPADLAARMRAIYESVFNEERYDLVYEYYAPELRFHDPSSGADGELISPADIIRICRLYRVAMPDLHYTVEDLTGTGDRYATRWTCRGTHRGPLLGVEATGRALSIWGFSLCRFEGDRIAEIWQMFDLAGLIQQISESPKTTPFAAMTAGRIIGKGWAE